jgi:hypothetical protein
MDLKIVHADKRIELITGVDQITYYKQQCDRFFNIDEKTYIMKSKEKHVYDIKTFDEIDLAGSDIIESEFNGHKYITPKYSQMLRHTMSGMTPAEILAILAKTKKMNIIADKNYSNGFKYYPNLGVSIQYADAHRTLKAIVHLCEVKGYSFSIVIKLKNRKICRFSL